MSKGAGRALPLAALFMGVLWSASADAGMTYKIDDTRSFSIGAGLRTSFAARGDSAGSRNQKWGTDFNLDNARIYTSGQIHEYIKVEINTECAFCGNGNLQEFVLLDGIAKIEINKYFNIWGGRLLVPSERVEMDGPFYGNVYENYKTPFYSSDYSVDFGSGGAGVYGRDHGVNVWGDAGKFKYVFGLFNGLRGSANKDKNPLFATRLAYQFLDVEDNPAYYTSSTYYGAADVLTLAYVLQYQADGAGSRANSGDFLGMNIDGLFEKKLAGAGTVTVEASFKYFDADFDSAAYSDPDAFAMFDGTAFTGTALYLFPDKVGIGMFQPYVRYTTIDPDDSSNRDEFETGLNYIIAGHNAKLALFYQYGDLATKSIVNFAPGVTGDSVSAIKLAIQLQI